MAEQDKQVAQQADLTPVVSLEEVRGVLAELSSSGKTAQVRQLILDAGAQRLSDVDSGKYGWLLDQAKGLS